MSDTNTLETAPLFTALTRPPMMAGITLDYLAVIFMVAMCVFVGLGNPLYLLTYVPLHLIGWVACRFDPNIFRVLYATLDCPRSATRAYWRCQSYAPY